MFFSAQGPCTDIAFPDVCKTPVVPFPHIDIGLGLMAIPNVPNILWCCMPAHNKKTVIPISLGDIAGIGLGVRMPSVMGPVKAAANCSSTFLIKGAPAKRMTTITKQNRGNARGIQLIPAQIKCLNFCA